MNDLDPPSDTALLVKVTGLTVSFDSTNVRLPRIPRRTVHS